MAHHAAPAIRAAQGGVILNESRDFGLDGLGQQLARTMAQYRRQGIVRN